MTMSGNNCNRFFSETHSTSPSLPYVEDLSNSLQNISLSDLGFVENSQTGDEGNRGSIGVHSTFFLGNQSSGNSIESAWSPASARGRVPQREGWNVQQRDIGRAYSVQDSMNGNRDMGSLYPPNLISLSDDQGVGPSTGYRIPQLELMGDQERGIWRTGSVLNLGLGSETRRIQRRQDYHWGLPNGWIGRDETSNESFMPNFRPDSRISYNGYNGSNSIRRMQSSDHLTGGLYFHGAQPTRTPFFEEHSDAGNTAPSCEWTDQPLPEEAVHLNYFRLHTGDLSLPEGLNCGDIQAIATNPIGCRYLLQILSGREPSAIQKILDETLEVVFEVMSDHIGNHLFQKLLDSCDDNQIETIVARVTECENSLTDVVNTKSGTRSVQKLVKIVKKRAPLIRCITLALIPRIQALMTSPYGCHVIHCLSQMPGCHYPLLYNAIVENCLAVATDEKGCVTLNFCINNSRSSFREKLLNIISDNSVFLSQDPYGNYVVQHVLALEVPNITQKIWHKLSGNYVRLSRQKNGSHVVEKCLWSSKRDCVIWELLNNEKFDQLARDQYGNYVIQTALITSEGELRNMLVETIMRHARSLRCNPYGRNVVKSLCSSVFSSS